MSNNIVADRPTGNGIEFEKLSAIKAKPVRWLVPGRIPLGKTTLLAGHGGDGKSTLTRHLVAKVTSGRPAFGMTYTPAAPGSVILMAAEDSFEEVVVPHLLAEGADLGRVSRVSYVKTEGKSRVRVHLGLEHLAELKAELKRRPDVVLVVIDPVASLMGRSGIDDHKQTELRKVLDPLGVLADETGVAVLLNAHLNKSTTARAADRIAGSVGYAAGVRLAYVLCHDPEDGERRLLMPVKTNLLAVDRQAAAFRLDRLTDTDAAGLRSTPALAALSDDDFGEVAAQLARVRFEASVDVRADDVMDTSRPKKEPNKVARCVGWLKTFLARYAYPSAEILAAANGEGFTFDNVKEAKLQAKADGLKHKKDGLGAWWAGFGEPSTWERRPEKTPGPRLVGTGSTGSHSSPGIPSSPSLEEGKEEEVGKESEQGEGWNADREPDGSILGRRSLDLDAEIDFPFGANVKAA